MGIVAIVHRRLKYGMFLELGMVVAAAILSGLAVFAFYG